VPCIIGHLCDTGSHEKKKINKGGGGGWANSSSKAFGISFADRPKAKTSSCTEKVFIKTKKRFRNNNNKKNQENLFLKIN
jgi:hypothetical protein